jgi:hypothetical protein
MEKQAAEEPRAAEPKQTQQHPDLSGLYFISFQPMGQSRIPGSSRVSSQRASADRAVRLGGRPTDREALDPDR